MCSAAPGAPFHRDRLLHKSTNTGSLNPRLLPRALPWAPAHCQAHGFAINLWEKQFFISSFLPPLSLMVWCWTITQGHLSILQRQHKNSQVKKKPTSVAERSAVQQDWFNTSVLFYHTISSFFFFLSFMHPTFHALRTSTRWRAFPFYKHLDGPSTLRWETLLALPAGVI